MTGQFQVLRRTLDTGDGGERLEAVHDDGTVRGGDDAPAAPPAQGPLHRFPA